MRLINADELRKNVLKWMPSDPCGKEEKEFPFETDICAGMIMEIDKAPTIVPKPRWIPVSERLPDGITQVIIQTNAEAKHEAIYMGKDDYGHYVWETPDGEIYWDEEVVAWMLFPESYKAESEVRDADSD